MRTLNTKVTRCVATGLLIALAGLLAGCSGASNDAGSTASDTSAGSSSLAGSTAGGTADRSDDSPHTANRAAVQTRAVIRTGHVSITGRHLDRTRADLDDLLAALHGTVDRDRTTHDRRGGIERATLVLRIPVSSFTAAMNALEKLGTMKSSSTASKDVTTQVIDVRERVQTLRNSLDRLHAFQRQSQNVNGLIRFEKEITDREAELQSLKAQRDYLDDQTAMSTITVTMTSPEKYVAPVAHHAGFVAGLGAGWHGLVTSLVALATVVGAVLPFAVVLTVFGVPLWFLGPRLLRRHRAGTAAQE